MTEINKKAFDECKFITEEIIKDTIVRSYFCTYGFIDTIDSPNSFEIKSYQFGYTKKIEKDAERTETKSLF